MARSPDPAWLDVQYNNRARIPEHPQIFDRWARLRQPVIAMLNGIAFGGGLELAACADLRVAEAHARLGLPEARIGIIPGWSGTQRLVRRVGPSTVKRLAFTGEPVDAEEALRLGLVDYLCPTGEGMAFARTLAATIAERAPIAVQTAKQLVNAAEGEERAAAFEAMCAPATARRTWALPHGESMRNDGRARSSSVSSEMRTSPVVPYVTTGASEWAAIAATR